MKWKGLTNRVFCPTGDNADLSKEVASLDNSPKAYVPDDDRTESSTLVAEIMVSGLNCEFSQIALVLTASIPPVGGPGLSFPGFILANCPTAQPQTWVLLF